jgi:hypothetical protein
MKKNHITPDWKWGTPEGSREFDRLLDRSLTFRETLDWLEAAETLAIRMKFNRRRTKINSRKVAA